MARNKLSDKSPEDLRFVHQNRKPLRQPPFGAMLARVVGRAIAARKSTIAGAAILVAFGVLFGWVVVNTI